MHGDLGAVVLLFICPQDPDMLSKTKREEGRFINIFFPSEGGISE